MEIESNDHPLVQDVPVSDMNQETMASASSNMDVLKVEIGSNDYPPVQHVPVSDMNQETMASASRNLDAPKVEIGSNDCPPVQHVPVSDMNQEAVAFTSSSMDVPKVEIGPNDYPLVQHVPVSDMNQEAVASASSNMDVPKVETSAHSFILADSQSLMPQMQPPVAHQSYVERAAAVRSIPGSLRLARKRKAPPQFILGSSVSEKRIEPVHHRPWLEQFSSAGFGQVHMSPSGLSPKAGCPQTRDSKVRRIEPDFHKSGKQVTNKKQTGLSQGLTKTQNEGNQSLRSKMKESLAAALALVQEHVESPKEKKTSETEEANVPVADGITPPALSTRDESSEHKDGNGGILLQDSSSDTNMTYLNQSDVQKTQFDEVFLRDHVPFSDSFFSSDELLQGNGLSWVLEPVSDLRENETGGIKSFEDPNLLASKIELELFKLFGGVNKKYKEKGRSLLFNLKDKNNPELRESVMSGKISPERLCSMTAEELASKELSEWRQAKAEKMAEMVVLRDADIDVSRLVRKTHKGEFQVEIDPVDSVNVDTSAAVTSLSKPRAKTKSLKSSNSAKSTLKKTDLNAKNTESEHGTSTTMTLPSKEEIDPMQGLSMDDEMKDLPPIVSLDEFMESQNSEPPHENHPVEEESSSDKSDSEVGSHSKSPKQSPKEPCEKLSPKSELEKTHVTSSKRDTGLKVEPEASEKVPLVDSIKEGQIWDGILQLSTSSVVSVTGIFKSGEKAKTSEWPTLVEVKGRVKLSAFGKFVKELPLSRSRVLMVMNLVCKEGISKSQSESLLEVANSYVTDQRVGYAEPTTGVEIYLCPPHGEPLDLLSKLISKDHLNEVKSSKNIGLIGVVVWRRPVTSPSSRHKPKFKRQPSSSGTKSSVLAQEHKKLSHVNVKNENVVAGASAEENHGKDDDDDEDEVPPGFGPDDDDLPEFNFDSSSRPVTISPRALPVQSRSLDQVRELILKYGNSAGNGSKRPWDDDDDDDDIPEWRPEQSGHQIQPPPPPVDIPEWQPEFSGHRIQPPPPPPTLRTEVAPQFHNRKMARPPPPALRRGAGPPGGWRSNQKDPRRQQYSGRSNRGF